MKINLTEKIFRKINSLAEQMFSRNFCQKSARKQKIKLNSKMIRRTSGNDFFVFHTAAIMFFLNTAYYIISNSGFSLRT